MWFEAKKPIIALAPMADMTDRPFCSLCREIGGKDFIIFREMVSAEAIVRNNEKTLKMCEFDTKERPIVLQIFGANPDTMAQAAKIIAGKFKPDGIDINMGCPVSKITGKNLAGAALMKNMKRAVAIVAALKDAKLGIPISVKTRLGWNNKEEILRFAPKLEAAGVDALSIHGRTKSQGFTDEADWEMIGEVIKLVKVPVLANGDIRAIEDIKKCLEITKAAGVMMGRGALGNPWIFRKITNFNTPARLNDISHSGRQTPNKDEIIKTILRHAKLHLEHYGEGSIVTFRKHLAWYFKGGRIIELKNVKELKNKLMRVKSFAELEEILNF